MEILGIGPSELVFIVILALIVLGPRDMQKAGRTIGKWLRQVVTSDGWKLFQQTSREIQTLPNRLMREAAVEELKEMERALHEPLESSPPATADPKSSQVQPRSSVNDENQADHRILPSPPPPTSTSPGGKPDE